MFSPSVAKEITQDMNFIDRGDLASIDLDLMSIPNFDDGNIHEITITDYLPEAAKASSNKLVLIRATLDATGNTQFSEIRWQWAQGGDTNGINLQEIAIIAAKATNGNFYAEGEGLFLLHCNAENKVQFSIAKIAGLFTITECQLIIRGVFV